MARNNLREVAGQAEGREHLRDRGFHRLDLQFQRLNDLPNNPRLREYLGSADVDIVSIDAEHPVQVRLARFPGMTFANLLAPSMRFLWARTAASNDKCLVIVVRRGSLEVTGDEGIVSREPGAFYVLPGESPISIQVTESETEFVYLTVPASLVMGPTLEDLTRVPTSSVSPGLLTPLYAFISSLCSLCISDDDDSDPLASAALEVTRSAVRLITGEQDRVERSLFGRAIEIILNEYPLQQLDGDAIARRLGTSSRSLQLAFQKEGATVAAEIRHVRAVAAANLRLEQPGLSRARVAELTGFSSVSTLDRALKQSGSQAILAG